MQHIYILANQKLDIKKLFDFSDGIFPAISDFIQLSCVNSDFFMYNNKNIYRVDGRENLGIGQYKVYSESSRDNFRKPISLCFDKKLSESEYFIEWYRSYTQQTGCLNELYFWMRFLIKWLPVLEEISFIIADDDNSIECRGYKAVRLCDCTPNDLLLIETNQLLTITAK